MAGNDNIRDSQSQDYDIELSDWIFENFPEGANVLQLAGSVDFSESSPSNNPVATFVSLLDDSSVISAEHDSSVITSENGEQQVASDHTNKQLPDLESLVGHCSNSRTISVSEYEAIPTEYNTFEEQVNLDPSREYLKTDPTEDKCVLIAESNINLTDADNVKSLSVIDERSIPENLDDRHYVLTTGEKYKIPTPNENKNGNLIEVIDLTENEPVVKRNYDSNVNDTCKSNRMSILLDILPDADVEFLRMKIDEIESDDEFQLFVATSLELQNYTKKSSLKNTMIRDISKVVTSENPITVFSKQQPFDKPINLSTMDPSTSTVNSALAPHPGTFIINTPPGPFASSYVGFQAPSPHVSQQNNPLGILFKNTKQTVQPTVNNKPHTVTSRGESTAITFPVALKDSPLDYSSQNLLGRGGYTTVAPLHVAVAPTRADVANNTKLNFTPLNSGINMPVNPRIIMPVNPGINMPVNPGINMPVNPGINMPVNPGINMPVNPGINMPVNPGINMPVNTGINMPVNPGINIPVYHQQPAAARIYERVYNKTIPAWIGVPLRREPRLIETQNVLYRIHRNVAADALAFAEILEGTRNHVNNAESSNPPTIEEQRYNLLAGILFWADPEFLRKEVEKMKNDEDVERFLVKSILNEKLWSGNGSSQKTPSRHTNSKLKILVELLPDVSIAYLKRESAKLKTDEDLQEFVLRLRSEQIYPRRKSTSHQSKSKKRKEPSESEQINPKYETLLEMLPDADPDFLLERSKSFLNDDELEVFVLKAVEENSYPKRDQYVERQEYQKQWKRYIENFDIQQYLQVIANPVKYFYIDKENSKNPLDIPVKFLQHRYRRKHCIDFDIAYRASKNSLTKICDNLDKSFPNKPRKYTSWDQETIFSIAVLQEIAFIQNKKHIARFVLLRDELKIIAYKKASDKGTLLECTCCYEEKLSEDMSSCIGGHVYCLDCIKRGSEVVIGNGGTSFPCYTDDCKEEFSLTVLKNVLNTEVFSRVLSRKQYAEVNAAGIPGLETCSFCEFCSIPPPEDKLFHCLNPSCMKITCRFCKKLDHLPLTCEEFEKTNTQKKMQSYVEDKMTEALVRTCWQCGTKFVKESGCNMMTCQCGAKMCYFCRQPITDYSHFSSGSCPQNLDTSAIDEDAVLNVGKKAKKEMETTNPGFQVSLDPTELLKRNKQHRHNRRHYRHFQFDGV